MLTIKCLRIAECLGFTTTVTNIAGTETLPGTSLRMSWAHGAKSKGGALPLFELSNQKNRTMTINANTRLAAGSSTLAR